MVRFSGTLRGGETLPSGYLVNGAPFKDRVGAQDIESDVFQWSGVLAPSGGGAKHDQAKSDAREQVEICRTLRAIKLSEKKDKEGGIALKNLQKETAKTMEFGVTTTTEAIVHLPETIQSWWGSFFVEPEPEKKIKQLDSASKARIAKQAASAKSVAHNAKEAAARAQQEMEYARTKSEQAKQCSLAAKDMPDKQHHEDNTDDTRPAKLPSSLKVSISHVDNYPTRQGKDRANPYVHFKFHVPGNNRVDVQQAVTKIKWKINDPDFLESFEFYINNDWDDEERPEELEITFYDCVSATTITKPVIGDDEVAGKVILKMNDVLTYKEEVRYPDGRMEPPFFAGNITKTYELMDMDTEEVVIGAQDEETPCQALIGIQYADSAKKAKPLPHLHTVQLPLRKPFVAPLPKPPDSWVDHPIRKVDVDPFLVAAEGD